VEKKLGHMASMVADLVQIGRGVLRVLKSVSRYEVARDLESVVTAVVTVRSSPVSVDDLVRHSSKGNVAGNFVQRKEDEATGENEEIVRYDAEPMSGGRSEPGEARDEGPTMRSPPTEEPGQSSAAAPDPVSNDGEDGPSNRKGGSGQDGASRLQAVPSTLNPSSGHLQPVMSETAMENVSVILSDERDQTVGPLGVNRLNGKPLGNAPEMGYMNGIHQAPPVDDDHHPDRMASARESYVPGSQIGRIFGFGQLGLGLVAGAASEATRRILFAEPSTSNPQRSAFLSDANAERIASSLSRMRGAALKIGQMLSIQDDRLLPPALTQALERVRQAADIMPRNQLEQVLTEELGANWRGNFLEFEELPIAAASIGQVHRASLSTGETVAVKVQYPGVAKSIESDLTNLTRLLTYAQVVPKQFFLGETMRFARDELRRECDYRNEARNQTAFRSLLGDEDPNFWVPRVIEDLSSERVLTSEFASGKPIDSFAKADSRLRNRIGMLYLRLTLRELFQFRFMQTDPNFSNFFYDPERDRLNLLDFGAATHYEDSFVQDYLEMVLACANKDRDQILAYGRKLGFLTGEENQTMLDAHVQASLIVGEPFATDDPYDFHSSNISARTAKWGKVMLDNRLCPPPKEAYSLHRRLSGAFLMCVRLRAVFPCREMLLSLRETGKV